MAKMKLRYAYEDRDRHGNTRRYFWRGKGHRKIRLTAEPGTKAFAEEYRRALEEETEKPASEPTAPAIVFNSYRWLCVQYFSSATFKRLDERTQRVRRGILEATFEEPVAPGSSTLFGQVPASKMTAKAIRVLRDRKVDLPEAANGRVKAVRQVFSFAIEQDLAKTNPAKDVPYLRSGSEGHHSWTIAEVEQFEERHPVGTKARLALALLLYLGTRRSDVVLFGRQHVRDGWLRFTQVKNRRNKPITLDLPVLPALREIIDQSPTGDLTFLVTEYGKPFTSNGFGNWFRKRCDEAGLGHCSAHGLRKSGAAIAAENGATEHQLMAIFGWLSPKEAARYTRAARQKTLAATAMPLLMRGEQT
jgi:integrase